MATTIQLVVAGVLLLAWIWALGRPLAGTVSQSDYRDVARDRRRRSHPVMGEYAAQALEVDQVEVDQVEVVESTSEVKVGVTVPEEAGERLEPTFDGEDFDGFYERDASWTATFMDWLHRPADAWRRQLMLATMLAAFASFLLAVALKGRFVILFLLMLGVLVVHLVMATYIGSRMLAVERAQAVQERKRRRQILPPATGAAIRAQRASEASLEDDQPEEVRVEEDAEPDPLDEDDPFAVAAALASELSATTPEPAETTTPPPSEPGPADPVPAGDGEDAGPDAIFRRAAKDEPRWRRPRSRPTYIESQLDEDGPDRPRAVNEP